MRHMTSGGSYTMNLNDVLIFVIGFILGAVCVAVFGSP
jgi:hypothetical protein